MTYQMRLSVSNALGSGKTNLPLMFTQYCTNDQVFSYF